MADYGTDEDLWCGRNSWVFTDKSLTPVEVVNRDDRVMGDYKKGRQIDSNRKVSQVVSKNPWIPPPAACGCCSDKFRCRPAFKHLGEGEFSPHVAECIATRGGVVFAPQFGHRRWVLESDAINVVTAIKG
ncbi:hypothetical protein L484_006128 [Morus notabilis]|uniref:Uncharacterized protein n=1 Tax=Morus notabilis TaxID=981085 RepID=W9RIJ7_9ROSA|nr:hypothetical protein L484_006128 [Morus notabilis]